MSWPGRQGNRPDTQFRHHFVNPGGNYGQYRARGGRPQMGGFNQATTGYGQSRYGNQTFQNRLPSGSGISAGTRLPGVATNQYPRRENRTGPRDTATSNERESVATTKSNPAPVSDQQRIESHLRNERQSNQSGRLFTDGDSTKNTSESLKRKLTFESYMEKKRRQDANSGQKVQPTGVYAEGTSQRSSAVAATSTANKVATDDDLNLLDTSKIMYKDDDMSDTFSDISTVSGVLDMKGVPFTMTISYDGGAFSCGECSFRNKDMIVLTNHVKECHRKKSAKIRYKCAPCKFPTDSLNGMKIHMGYSSHDICCKRQAQRNLPQPRPHSNKPAADGQGNPDFTVPKSVPRFSKKPGESNPWSSRSSTWDNCTNSRLDKRAEQEAPWNLKSKPPATSSSQSRNQNISSRPRQDNQLVKKLPPWETKSSKYTASLNAEQRRGSEAIFSGKGRESSSRAQLQRSGPTETSTSSVWASAGVKDKSPLALGENAPSDRVYSARERVAHHSTQKSSGYRDKENNGEKDSVSSHMHVSESANNRLREDKATSECIPRSQSGTQASVAQKSSSGKFTGTIFESTKRSQSKKPGSTTVTSSAAPKAFSNFNSPSTTSSSKRPIPLSLTTTAASVARPPVSSTTASSNSCTLLFSSSAARNSKSDSISKSAALPSKQPDTSQCVDIVGKIQADMAASLASPTTSILSSGLSSKKLPPHKKGTSHTDKLAGQSPTSSPKSSHYSGRKRRHSSGHSSAGSASPLIQDYADTQPEAKRDRPKQAPNSSIGRSVPDHRPPYNPVDSCIAVSLAGKPGMLKGVRTSDNKSPIVPPKKVPVRPATDVNPLASKFSSKQTAIDSTKTVHSVTTQREPLKPNENILEKEEYWPEESFSSHSTGLSKTLKETDSAHLNKGAIIAKPLTGFKIPKQAVKEATPSAKVVNEKSIDSKAGDSEKTSKVSTEHVGNKKGKVETVNSVQDKDISKQDTTSQGRTDIDRILLLNKAVAGRQISKDQTISKDPTPHQSIIKKQVSDQSDSTGQKKGIDRILLSKAVAGQQLSQTASQVSSSHQKANNSQSGPKQTHNQSLSSSYSPSEQNEKPAASEQVYPSGVKVTTSDVSVALPIQQQNQEKSAESTVNIIQSVPGKSDATDVKISTISVVDTEKPRSSDILLPDNPEPNKGFGQQGPSPETAQAPKLNERNVPNEANDDGQNNSVKDSTSDETNTKRDENSFIEIDKNGMMRCWKCDGARFPECKSKAVADHLKRFHMDLVAALYHCIPCGFTSTTCMAFRRHMVTQAHGEQLSCRTSRVPENDLGKMLDTDPPADGERSSTPAVKKETNAKLQGNCDAKNTTTEKDEKSSTGIKEEEIRDQQNNISSTEQDPTVKDGVTQYKVFAKVESSDEDEPTQTAGPVVKSERISTEDASETKTSSPETFPKCTCSAETYTHYHCSKCGITSKGMMLLVRHRLNTHNIIPVGIELHRCPLENCSVIKLYAYELKGHLETHLKKENDPTRISVLKARLVELGGRPESIEQLQSILGKPKTRKRRRKKLSLIKRKRAGNVELSSSSSSQRFAQNQKPAVRGRRNQLGAWHVITKKRMLRHFHWCNKDALNAKRQTEKLAKERSENNFNKYRISVDTKDAFECHCSKFFTSKQGFQNHMFGAHNEKIGYAKYYKCTLCSYRTTYQVDFKKHKQSQGHKEVVKEKSKKRSKKRTSSERPRDSEPNTVSDIIKTFLEKYRRRGGSRYYCSVCGYSTTVSNHMTFLDHLYELHDIHHEDVWHFQCDACRPIFRTVKETRAEVHCRSPTHRAATKVSRKQESSSSDEETTRKSCDKNQQSGYTTKKVKKSSGKIMQTGKHDKKEDATVIKSLWKYQRYNSFVCTCDYTSQSAISFENHLYSQHNIKVAGSRKYYQCSICKPPFKTIWESSLRRHEEQSRHLQSLASIRQFKEQTKDQTNRVHKKLKVTEKEKKKPTETLQVHFVETELFKCGCKAQFNDISSLTDHLKTEHRARSDMEYKCQFCNKSYKDFAKFGKHLKSENHDYEVALVRSKREHEAAIRSKTIYTSDSSDASSSSKVRDVRSEDDAEKDADSDVDTSTDNLMSENVIKIISKGLWCESCDFLSHNFSELVKHMGRKHASHSSQTHLFVCDACSFEVSKVKDFLVHVINDTHDKCMKERYGQYTKVVTKVAFCITRKDRIICVKCNRKIFKVERLVSHAQERHGLKTDMLVLCKLCNEILAPTIIDDHRLSKEHMKAVEFEAGEEKSDAANSSTPAPVAKKRREHLGSTESGNESSGPSGTSSCKRPKPSSKNPTSSMSKPLSPARPKPYHLITLQDYSGEELYTELLSRKDSFVSCPCGVAYFEDNVASLLHKSRHCVGNWKKCRNCSIVFANELKFMEHIVGHECKKH